ncbi:MAG: hypothetical protein ACW98W_20400 [Candidatus Hodarchaeales archaeon]|jgi:hypothetical protein
MSDKIHNYFFGQQPELPWHKKENKMEKEILAIPEENLLKVVKVIRAGLDYQISEHQIRYDDEVYIKLTRWCEEMWKHYTEKKK